MLINPETLIENQIDSSCHAVVSVAGSRNESVNDSDLGHIAEARPNTGVLEAFRDENEKVSESAMDDGCFSFHP